MTVLMYASHFLSNLSVPGLACLPCARGTQQRPFCTRQRLCHVLHMTNGRRQRDSLPCAIYQAHGKEFADYFKIGNKKDLIRRGPHHPATHPLCQVASWGIFCALHGRQDLNPQPPSCVTFSTTALHYHLCLYFCCETRL